MYSYVYLCSSLTFTYVNIALEIFESKINSKIYFVNLHKEIEFISAIFALQLACKRKGILLILFYILVLSSYECKMAIFGKRKTENFIFTQKGWDG